MAKKTYLYKVEMQNSQTKQEKTQYFYGRNLASVTRYCHDNYYPIIKYDIFKANKVGESKYLVKEPVVEFDDEETEQIEDYFLKDALKYIGAEVARKAAANGEH